MRLWLKSAADVSLDLARGIGVGVLAAVAMVEEWRGKAS